MTKPTNLFQHPELDGSSFFWEGNSTGILLFHGFTATTVEVQPIAKFLHDFGYTVSAPLLPGHGHTPEELNRVTWKDWGNCAEEAYKQLNENCEKLFVLGESMGGLLALSLSISHPEISGEMLFAPALKVPNLSISQFIWPFKSVMLKSHIDETMEWQGFNVIPMHAAAELAKLQRYVKLNINQVITPTVVFQGKLDHSIDPMSSVMVLEGISSTEKELIWMNESTHCVLIDRQLPDVEELCLKFIRDH